MTARKPAGPTEQERLIGELIGVLAGALADKDREERLARNGAVTRRRVTNARAVRPLAVAVVRQVSAGNRANAEALLSVHRTQSEWKRLALMLASAADVNRLAPAGWPLRREGGQAA